MRDLSATNQEDAEASAAGVFNNGLYALVIDPSQADPPSTTVPVVIPYGPEPAVANSAAAVLAVITVAVIRISVAISLTPPAGSPVSVPPPIL